MFQALNLHNDFIMNPETIENNEYRSFILSISVATNRMDLIVSLLKR